MHNRISFGVSIFVLSYREIRYECVIIILLYSCKFSLFSENCCLLVFEKEKPHLKLLYFKIIIIINFFVFEVLKKYEQRNLFNASSLTRSTIHSANLISCPSEIVFPNRFMGFNNSHCCFGDTNA